MQSGGSVSDIQIVPKLPTNLWELPAHGAPMPLPSVDDCAVPLVYQGAKSQRILDRQKDIATELAATNEALRNEAFSYGLLLTILVASFFFAGVRVTVCELRAPRQLLALLPALFGVKPLGPPASEADDGKLCLWVGETKFEWDARATPTISVCLIIKVNASDATATVRTLRAPYGVWRNFIE